MEGEIAIGTENGIEKQVVRPTKNWGNGYNFV